MRQLQRSINHQATAFAGRYNDFLFPTRHNHSLCYVNKTGWLSMDLSAAAAACSAPENRAAERDTRLKPRQSLTPGKVTHHIPFRFVYFGWRCIFLCFFSSSFFFFFFSLTLTGSRHCEASFQPLGLSFLKESCGRSACVCYHRRETEALIQHAALLGSKRTQNDTNQSLSKSLEGGIFAILETR